MHPEDLTHFDDTAEPSRLPMLSMVAILLAIGCILLAMLTSSRISRLHADARETWQQRNTSETSSVNQIQSERDAAVKKLGTVQENLEKETAAAAKLRSKLATINKALEGAKAQLIDANKKIAALEEAINKKAANVPQPSTAVEIPGTVPSQTNRSDNPAPATPSAQPPAVETLSGALPIQPAAKPEAAAPTQTTPSPTPATSTTTGQP